MQTQYIVIALSAVSIPLYVAVLILVYKEPTCTNLFYTLTLFQGCIDLFTMCCGLLFNYFRDYSLIANFLGTYIPTWCYTQVYVNLYLRVCGVLIITVQRYLAICHPLTKLYKVNASAKSPDETVVQLTTKTPPIIIFHTQVILGVLIASPLFFQNAVFVKTETGLGIDLIDVPLAANTIQAAFVCSVCTLICTTCYSLIIRRIAVLGLSGQKQTTLRTEVKLAIHGFALFFIFLLITAHYVVMCASTLWPSAVSKAFQNELRAWYGVWSAVLSYVSPYMILTSNAIIRRRLCCAPPRHEVIAIASLSVGRPINEPS